MVDAMAPVLAQHRVRTSDTLARWRCSCGAGGVVEGPGEVLLLAAALHQARSLLTRLLAGREHRELESREVVAGG
jgi:hypothetical protein